jgi:HlyD family secretion protein
MKPFRVWSVLGLAVLLVMGISLYKTIAAGPANVARPSDRATAAREIATKGGGMDDRDTLAPVGYVSGSGVVEPADRETRVAGQVAGRIAKIWVKERETVAAGAPLVELESGTERAALDAVEADVAVQSAALQRTVRGLRAEDVEALIEEAGAAKARAESSADILVRNEKLAESGAITHDELDRARRQAEADDRTFKAADARRLGGVHGGRREDVLVAQAQVRAASARRDQARAELTRLTVRAPIDGTILQLKYRVGEYYSPAPPAGAAVEPLVVLGDLRAIRVRIDVDERAVARIKLGAKSFVTMSAFSDRRFPGTVVEIAARMGRKNVRTDDPVERLDVKILEVVLQIAEPLGLVPGIRVTGYIEAGAN